MESKIGIGTREVELSVTERYALARMQPTKGNFIELTMSKALITLLELQPEEAEKWGYVQQGKGRWVASGAEDSADDLMATITMSVPSFDRIAQQLEAMSKAGTLEMAYYRLYELFVRQPERADEDEAVRGLRAVETGA